MAAALRAHLPPGDHIVMDDGHPMLAGLQDLLGRGGELRVERRVERMPGRGGPG